MQNTNQFYYFDGPEERETVILAVRDVRQDVIDLAQKVPKRHHFKPRYEGRSLAETLVHLQFAGAAALWFVRTSANLRDDFKLHPPAGLVYTTDQLLRRFFRRRQVGTTIEDLQKQEKAICEFIREIPMEVLHKDVCHPGRREPYTVEKAIQIYFIHYWQHHLDLMRQVEGVPNKRS